MKKGYEELEKRSKEVTEVTEPSVDKQVLPKEEAESKEEAKEKGEEANKQEETAQPVLEEDKGKNVVAAAISSIAFVLIIVILVILAFYSCSKKADTSSDIVPEEISEEEPLANPPVVESTQEEEVATVEEEPVAEEPVEEETTEEAVEEETEKTLTIEEWLDSLNTIEIKYCIWNKAKSKGYVLEDNNTYQLEEDDFLVIYMPEEVLVYSLPSVAQYTNKEKYDNYYIMEISFEGEVEFSLYVLTYTGKEYSYDVTLIAP